MLNFERTVFVPTENGIKNMGMGDLFLENRAIYLTGEITEETGVEINQQLIYLDTLSNEPIHLYINSPGGSIIAGLTILDTMETINSPVYTVNIGECCSMAFAILTRGDRRFTYASSIGMCHQASAGCWGNVQDMRISLKLTEDLNTLLLGKISEAMEIEEDKLRELSSRDWFLTSQEMLEWKVVDKILKPKKNVKGKRSFNK